MSPPSALSDRTVEVLTAATAALEAGTDPFGEGFLAEHAVTLDECYRLAELLALGARLIVATMRLAAGAGPDKRLAALLLTEAGR